GAGSVGAVSVGAVERWSGGAGSVGAVERGALERWSVGAASSIVVGNLTGVAVLRDLHSTTQLLEFARAGDRDAVDALFPRVYDELRILAHARLRRNNPGDAFNTTALVHEAYLKLTAGETPSVADRSHFFALAARAMRF